MSLNVISALTRLGVDPWEEATRLADLPKAVAAEALARLVARSPIDRPQPSDNLAISQQLVELLPRRRDPSTPRREQAGATDKKYFDVVMVLACLAPAAVALCAVL